MKKAIILLILFGAGIFSLQLLIRQSVRYVHISDRATNIKPSFNDKELKTVLSDDIDRLLKLSLKQTSDSLEFAVKNDFNKNQANCIGYAVYYVEVLNAHLLNNNITEWQVKPVVGQLRVANINIHDYINSPFFKDHDYVSVVNKTTGQEILIDPSLYDYTGIYKVKAYDGR
jgi:hypothetical protein